MMMEHRRQFTRLFWLAVMVGLGMLLGACTDAQPTPVPTPTSNAAENPEPTATPPATEPVGPEPPEPTPAVANRWDDADFITVAMDVPDRSGLFANFDEFGNVLGVDPDMLTAIADAAQIDTELIVTSFDGMLEAVAAGEFAAGMSRIDVNEMAPDGIAYSEPYFTVEQVMMVRANETEVMSWRDISADMPVAVVSGSAGERAAREVMAIGPVQTLVAETPASALQLLSDFGVRAAIVDSYDAVKYAERYYQRLQILDDNSAESFISQQQYVIAVAAENKQLLSRINDAIAQLAEADTAASVSEQWLVDSTPIRAGDSLIGTPPDRLLIGVVGDVVSFDPATSAYNPLDWELLQNSMSSLLGYDANNQLVPVLAADLPTVSADQLEYTFTLRDGLIFADRRPVTAGLVLQSLQRIAATANAHYIVLKDSNLDGFADNDAIQAVDERTIKFVLDEPDSTFLSRLATPAFAIMNPRCDVANLNPADELCMGIGPYRVDSYEPGFAVRLEVNPDWPLEPPLMEKVELRLYRNSADISAALASSAIDVAWLGVSEEASADLRSRSGIQSWQGPGIFKSYMVFEQGAENDSPWEDVRLRQAAALAVDREAITAEVFGGTRSPLYSPLVDGIPEQISAEPQRNLEEAVALLQSAGYSSSNRLEVDIWYLNDGRYTDLEQQYAEAIAAQLEETEIFDVTLNGEGWGVYSGQMSTCNYPAFLLGWPPSSRLPYLEGMNWIAHFVYNAAVVCSNYESAEMLALLDELFETVDPDARALLYADIQALWAQEYPTLDLYQQTRDALALNKVTDLKIDGLGMLRYDTITKPDQ